VERQPAPVSPTICATSFRASILTPKSDPAQDVLGNNHCRSMLSFFFDCHKRLIRVIEGEYCNVWTDAEVMGNLEKVARVLPGHIGHTADLPFTPEQVVVVEGRHMIVIARSSATGGFSSSLPTQAAPSEAASFR
jgi:hypothetical protein